MEHSFHLPLGKSGWDTIGPVEHSLCGGTAITERGQTSTFYRKRVWEQKCQRLFLRKPKYCTFQRVPPRLLGEKQHRQAPLESADLSVTISLISGAGDRSVVFFPLTHNRGMKGFKEQKAHRANSLKWAWPPDKFGATSPRQRLLRICTERHSWDWKNRWPAHFLIKQNWTSTTGGTQHSNSRFSSIIVFHAECLPLAKHHLIWEDVYPWRYQSWR